ncbi:tyrosine-protein phosphatase non-receptor type 2 isoform X2 [Gouania willdenowi]|uniref:tyrosine-protein phosphatase non-receptor type 2 isoform X2 n=1 Tax=Gouania willdenowi TaxID=441366 RepID=UPI001055FA4E|nr:tyrosine-protein phosphatase non-receptor type 2-like isoform X2 [Gouania willdenowi]
MEKEFEDVDSEGHWQKLFSEIRNESQEFAYKVAKYPENRNRNRYRDVSPFDHSRVMLENTENDYINASLVVVEEAQRSYILTQGPLRNTCGHFWLMIWQQRTKAVIMLNRVIEKGSEKCAQYWPTTEEREMAFRDTCILVTLLSEDTKSYYTTRILELQNVTTGEKRQLYHFHYTTWPDFGVPESPASFLNFLFRVRESRALEVDHGPAVVHCSAGIGRSGTFSLVDTCLVLNQWRELSKEDQRPLSGSPPSAQPQARFPPEQCNGIQQGGQVEEEGDYRQDSEAPSQSLLEEKDGSTTHKRRREDGSSKSDTAMTSSTTKARSSDSEKKRKRTKSSDS